MFFRKLYAAFAILVFALAAACGTSGEPADNGNDSNDDDPPVEAEAETVVVAHYNTFMFGDEAGELIENLSDPDYEQGQNIAEVIQIHRPDVVLVQEFDYDENQEAAQLFEQNFLSQPQGDQDALEYPYYYAPPSNTGIPSGHDLNGSGETGGEEGTEEYAGNSFGYGQFPGQYGFVIYSKYPIDTDAIRSFQHFLWQDMPNNLMPNDFYSDEAEQIFRLSSKNHVDVPIDIGDQRLHILASHPTPPAFDGDEERNQRRNQDEVRLWHDYIRPDHSDYLYDDDEQYGGLDEDAHFIIAGDLNTDRHDSDPAGAVGALLDAERTTDPKPTSEGGPIASQEQGGANNNHTGDPALVTADWNPQGPGNLRVDYAIPSSNLSIEDTGVFWPAPDQPFADLVETSDHRLVWVEVTIGE